MKKTKRNLRENETLDNAVTIEINTEKNILTISVNTNASIENATNITMAGFNGIDYILITK